MSLHDHLVGTIWTRPEHTTITDRIADDLQDLTAIGYDLEELIVSIEAGIAHIASVYDDVAMPTLVLLRGIAETIGDAE